MISTEKRISTAQLFALVFILGMSLKMMMLPVLLLKSCGRDSVIAMFVILVAELVCLAGATAAIALSPQKSFGQLLKATVGKIAAKIIFALMAAMFFLKLLLLSGEVRIFFAENLFTEFPWCVYSVPFFALTTVISMGTARAIGRTAQFLFPLILAATVLMLFLIGRGVDFTEVFPFGEFAARDVAADSLRYAMWYGDYSALVVFLGSVKRSRKTVAISMISGVAASAVVLFFTLGLTASFSNVCYIIHFGQNVTGMSHYALGNIMQGRIDLILFCVWMMSVFLKGGMFAYAAAYCIRAIAPMNRTLPALILGITLFVISCFIPSATGLHTVMADYMAIPAIAFQFAVPALMLTVSLLGRRRERKCEECERMGEDCEQINERECAEDDDA